MTRSMHCKLGDLFENRRERGRPGLPVLSVTLSEGLVDRNDLDRKHDSALTPEEHLLVKPGDIAYNTMRMWQGAFGLADREGIVSPAYVVLKPKPGTNSEYIAHLLRTDRLQYLLWAYSYGITEDRLRLYFQDFSAIPVMVLECGDQKRVASLLTTVNSLIENVRQTIDNLDSEMRALMRRLLSPARSQWRQFAWRRQHLGDLVQVDRSTLSASTPDSFRFRYISLSDVDNGRIADSLREYSFLEAPSRARRKVEPGDVLMATVRPGLKSYAVVGVEHQGCIASTGFAVLSCSGQVLPKYLYYYLLSKDIQRQINSLVAGSNYPAIGSADVVNLQLNVPDDSTQRRIISLLGSIDDRTRLLKKKRELLVQEQRALSQRLLSQKITGQAK